MSETDRLLIVMVGLPRSGKSTWAKLQGPPMVALDAVRLALHGERFLSLAEPMVHDLAKYMVNSLFIAGHSIVIVDCCNGTRKRRDFWRPDRDGVQYGVQFKVVDTSADECKRRAFYQADDVLVPVIERMAAAWEPLGPDEQPFEPR